MEKYYCHKCALRLGHLNTTGLEQLNSTGSTYQLEKYVKYTLPSTKSGLISIFSDASYDSYKRSIVNALASGSTIVNNSQIDVVWFSNQAKGISFVNGVPQNNTDVVKTVLHHDASKIHSYPVNSADLITKPCDNCSITILTGSTT